MRPYTSLFISVAAVGITAATGAIAQDQPAQGEAVQTQPAASTTSAAAVNPARGSTMDSVRAKFGTPSQEVPAVGKPPITRWEYPGYVVFFEYDRVLHTVAVK
jgi:hypothetical protein